MIRQVYAQDLYYQTAKEVGKENYVRGYLDYGKNTVLKVSKNLGHNRKDVIKSYLYASRSLNLLDIVNSGL